MVDQKHPVIVHAEAFGQAQEQSLLEPMLAGTREAFRAIGVSEDIFREVKLLGDSGFFTEANLKKRFEEGFDADIPDTQFRKRDERFANAARHKPPKADNKSEKFTPKDFGYDAEKRWKQVSKTVVTEEVS